MITGIRQWEKLGRIVKPDCDIDWMSTFAGPSFGRQVTDGLVDIYMAGRDSRNRSQIGKIRINIDDPTQVIELSHRPVFSVGELGAFDENGVSYPYIVDYNGKTYLYYLGWMPTVLTPFQVHIGLAELGGDGYFKRISRAPILERTHEEPLSTGSCCVLVEDGEWKMWYTGFLRWGQGHSDHKHYYTIKYATSHNGIRWNRNNHICINIQDQQEYSICRPSVIVIDNVYHMWYCYRGEFYRIGYAHSSDGVHWNRDDALAGMQTSKTGWDSESLCYPHVFRFNNYLYMLYNGNEYGRTGLGISRRKI